MMAKTPNLTPNPGAAWPAMAQTGPIYLDHQATTPLDPQVLQAMLPYWTHRFGNPHAMANAHGRAAADVVQAALASVGRLIGAPGAAMVLTSGATEANAIVVSGIAAGHSGPRKQIIIGCLEHPSVTEAARLAGLQHGLTVDWLPATRHGVYDLERLAALLSPQTLLVSTMAANNEIGTIQPLAEIGPLVRQHGAVWHVDAAQAPLGMTVDVNALGIDLLTLSAHKMHGPQGVGALYVRPSPPIGLRAPQPGGGQQRGLRGGTVPVALAVGMARAAELVRTNAPAERHALASLRDQLQAGLLAARPDMIVLGQHAPRLPNCLAVQVPGLDAEDLLLRLSSALSLSTGAACASSSRKPSATLQALGLTASQIAGALRFGVGRFTTPEDIDRALSVLTVALTS